MRWLPLLTCVGLLATATFTTQAPALFPQPSLYPITWELDFKHDQLRRIVLEVPGERSPKAYWYMTYVATNNTNQEQVFLPTFEMVTRDGKVVRANTERSRKVFEQIAQRERSKPLQSDLDLQGRILIGEDQAKYGVAIWEEPAAELGAISLYVSGLSGEITPLTDSQGKPIADKDGNPLVLRKTLKLDYTIRGDDLYANDPVIKTGESWVMR
jgi:hypothetical protein